MNALLKENKKTVFIFALCYGQNIFKNIKIYAYHGCMEEEKKIGSDYLVNLIVHADLSLS